MLDRLPQTILESVSLIPLPALPQVLVRFLALVEDENASVQELATLVAHDPAFTARILSVATSPPYRQEPVAVSLEQSLAALGKPLLRLLASCMAVQNVQTQATYDRNFDYPGFWSHSLRVAALARSLAAAVSYRDKEEAYLAGLLHDIGQLLLVGGVGEFCDSFPKAKGNEQGVAGIAQILSGIDPALVGARLVDNWNFSSFLADAVLFHGYSGEQIASADMLCRIVWSAHLLAGFPADLETAYNCSADLQKMPAILGIDSTTINHACRSAFAWVEVKAADLGVQACATVNVHSNSRFIYPHISLPKRSSMDADNALLEDLVRNQAVMQPLQESLITLPEETDLYAALRESARLLFGMQRPVFLVPDLGRSALVAMVCAGQHPLLCRLEFPIEAGESLIASAFLGRQPISSFSDEGNPVDTLHDLQMARLLGSQGLFCIPMIKGEESVGVMVFGLSAEQYVGKRRLLNLLSGFGRMAARSMGMLRCLHERDQRIATELSRQFEQRARKIVHEAVNPLGVISNYLNIFSDRSDNSPEVLHELTILKDEISRVERIVRGFSSLHEQTLPVETVNVNGLIEGMLALYGESLFETRGINIEKQLDQGVPHIRGERDSLKQILFNLWKNSAEAMPAGGFFRIATCTTDRDGDCGCVEIRMGDSGPGIPADIMSRLFQPLEPGLRPDNSGVGLSIVASLVERLGGEVSCNSSPGQGTEFTIRFAQV